MIQFKRGTTSSWTKQKKPLAAGQPGYDKDRQKIKIGDGERNWDELPYASGLFADEILCSEADAKDEVEKKRKLGILFPISTAINNLVSKALNKNDRPIITYGTESPDENTVGQIYLQQYDTEPEVDYIVSTGTNRGWFFQKWKSGFARCTTTYDFTTAVQTAITSAGLFHNNVDFKALQYPFTFKDTPCETATIQSPGGFVWLAASKNMHAKSHSAIYNVVSPDSLNNATYRITLQVEGFWR